MIAELFEVERVTEQISLDAMRADLEQVVKDAQEACDSVPEWMIDAERAKEVFAYLASDGDTEYARDHVRMSFDFSGAGFGKYLDLLLDHVNVVAMSFWRLHRAERRVCEWVKKGRI